MHKLMNFDIRHGLKSAFQKLPSPFVYGFLSLFIGLNLIFIYHGAHFLFGDHDWMYLRRPLSLGAGLFEGRFTQFILINILCQGEILPILNNVWGFFFFALGIALLGKYWQLPENKTSYVLFCLTIGLTPYILSFMYFAFLIMPILSWNLFIVGGLYLSEKGKTLKSHIFAVMVLLSALGGYPPVVNMIAVVLSIRLLIAVLYESESLMGLYRKYRQTVINILISGALYKLIFWGLSKHGDVKNSYYNLQTITLAEIPQKLLHTVKNIWYQFHISLPFISAEYKAVMFILCLTGLGAILYHIKKKTIVQKVSIISLTFISLIAPLTVFFISTSAAETEFSPRIDFFGLIYLYGGFMALALLSSHKVFKNIAFMCGLCALLISCLNNAEAQKIWRLGFQNELKLYDRIGKRFMQHELFNPYGRYIVVQDSDVRTLRKRYYQKEYDRSSDDLLDIPYVPGMNAAQMWNFYGLAEYGDKPAYVYTFRPDDTAKKALENARPWPAPESTAVGPYWIMYFMYRDTLQNLQKNYLPKAP